MNLSMNFADLYRIFFESVCDITFLIQLFCFSLATVILVWPKKATLKSAIILIGEFIGVYAASFLLSSVCFPLDWLLLSNSIAEGVVFSLPQYLVPALFIIFFTPGKPRHKILKIALFFACVALCLEMSRDAGRIMGFISHDNFFLVVVSRSLPYVMILPNAYLMWRYDVSRYSSLSKPLFFIAIFVSLLMIVTTILEKISLRGADNYAPYIPFVIVYVGLSLVLGILYYSIYNVIETRHRLVESEVQMTLTSAERQAMALDAQNRDELAKLRHDLNNQLAYLNNLLKEGKTEDAKVYLDRLETSKQEALESFSCPNAVISSIVNLEIAKAQLRHVVIQPKVIVPPNLPIEDLDLVSLITNVVDNAIENTASGSEPIRLTIITYQDYLRISCFNPIEAGQEEKAKTLLTKKNDRRHGYGVKIIKNIAQSYSGYASFSVEEKSFVCDAILTLRKKEGNFNA